MIYDFTATLIDGEGHKSNVSARLNAVNEAAAITRAGALLQHIYSFIDGKVLGAKIAINLTLPVGNPAVPDAGSDVELKGVFTFLCANGKRMRISVPTLNRAHIFPNTDVLDDNGPEGFAGEIIDGGWVDSNDSDVVSLISQLEGYGKKR